VYASLGVPEGHMGGRNAHECLALYYV
jgi:hypothetical protein